MALSTNLLIGYLIIALIVILLGYNIYKLLINNKNKKRTEKLKDKDIKKEEKVENEKHAEATKTTDGDNNLIKEDQTIPNKHVFIPVARILLIVSLMIMLTSLLMPAISVLGFQMDLYQIYQIIIHGIMNHSLSLQSLIVPQSNASSPAINSSLQSLIGSQSNTVPPAQMFPLRLIGVSLILYIISIIVISLSIKFKDLDLAAGTLSISYSVFFIVGLNYLTTIFNIPLSIVGFGTYFGIISGIIIITSYYIRKVYDQNSY